MNTLVTVLKANPGHVDVRLELGGNRIIARNLPCSMLPRFTIRFVKQRLLRLVNHRERIMNQHGGRNTVRKAEACSKVRQRLSMSEKWSIEVLARQVIHMEEDLLQLIPGTSSKFYQTHSQLVFDLIHWAKSYCDEKLAS
ncbi:MAG: hypothetical protein LPK80_07415 [Bacteroidota bacterium]|nr:hypothetical protein [Bacteroidota bacterium]